MAIRSGEKFLDGLQPGGCIPRGRGRSKGCPCCTYCLKSFLDGLFGSGENSSHGAIGPDAENGLATPPPEGRPTEGCQGWRVQPGAYPGASPAGGGAARGVLVALMACNHFWMGWSGQEKSFWMGCISFLDGLHIVSGWAAYRQSFLDGLHIVSEKFLVGNRFWMGCTSSD